MDRFTTHAGNKINDVMSILHADIRPTNNVIPALVAGIHFSAKRNACGTMDTGDPGLHRGRRAPV